MDIYADYLADYYYRNPNAAEEAQTDDFDAELAAYVQDGDQDWDTLIDEGDDGR